MNYLSKMFAFLIAVLLLFIVPAYRTYWITEQAVLKQLNYETQEFVNNVRHKGYVSKTVYENYIEKLAKTGNVYDIEMQHIRKVIDYVPDPANNGNFIVADYDDIYPSEYIINAIYDPGTGNRYCMKQGDSFSVTVVNKSRTGIMVFINLLGGKGDTSFLFSKYGGMITNEDY